MKRHEIAIMRQELEYLYGTNYMYRKAIDLAEKFHKNVPREDGEPYYNHVLRVAWRVCDEGVDDVIVGLLHDSVEDGYITLTELRTLGFSEYVVVSIDALSRKKAERESYFAFIMRIIRSNLTAMFVKLADLEDNMMDGKEGNRLDKYRMAHYIISGVSFTKTRRME